MFFIQVVYVAEWREQTRPDECPVTLERLDQDQDLNKLEAAGNSTVVEYLPRLKTLLKELADG